MDYGFKNSKLKKQLEDLEAEKRRLLLAREVTLSPFEIQKVSRSLGGERVAAPTTISLRTPTTHRATANASSNSVKAKAAENSRAGTETTKPAVRTIASAAHTDTPATREARPTLELTAMAKVR